MPELDRRHRAEVLEKIRDPPIAAHMLVRVHARAMMRASAACLDRGLLAAHDTGTADRELPEVDKMPVGQIAVVRQILRHRTEHDAVAGGDAAHGDRAE